VHAGSFENGDNAWFLEGRLNASYNCVDRHAFKNPDKPAIIYEADDAGDGRIISYGELLRQVSKLAYTLKEMGVKKGDSVAIYLPMIPEAVISLLACTRIGAVHSVVFAGFSSDSLRDRIIDAESKVVITTDEGKRGGKVIGTKKIVDEALKQCPNVSHCLVYKRTGADVPWTKDRDLWWHEEVEKYPNYIAPESMNSEDPLFLLYTSGSTGKPKGVMHTTGGYLIGAAMTGKYVFDIHDDDVFFCGGDVGWITGHTYVVYAPLLLGVATVVFEGTPAYPDFSRYWEIVDKYNVSQFYVAPTALRLLKRAGDEHVKQEMKHLRILGSVGEPIAAEVWNWYFKVVGKELAHVVDVSQIFHLIVDRTHRYRHTGKLRLVLMSLLPWAVLHLQNLGPPLSPSLVSNLLLSTPSLAKRSMAMMSRVCLLSSSHGRAWLAQSGEHISGTWTHT
jgi:acetyl-CoA synthetase